MDQRPSDFRPPVGPDADSEQKMQLIRADMEGTRASLVGKLETLQERVSGKIDQTVESVQDAVQTVKRTLDIPYQTQQRPWLMVGAAFLAGSVIGCLTAKPRAQAASKRSEQGGGRSRKHAVSATNGRSHEREPVARPAQPGIFTEELQKIKGMAVGAGMALVRDWIKQAAPGLADQIEQVMDNATRKLGGEPIDGAPFEPASRFDGVR